MTLHEFFRSLRRGVWFILASVVICGGLGVAYVATAAKSYTAETQLFVSTATFSNNLDQSFNGSQFISNRVQSYALLAQTDEVTKPVITSLGLSLTPSQLAGRITADVPLDTVVLNLSVEDASASSAASVANAVANRLVQVVSSLESARGDGVGSPVRLTVVRQATPPTSPSSPQTVLDVALAVVVGLAIGVAFSVARGNRGRPLSGPGVVPARELVVEVEQPVPAVPAAEPAPALPPRGRRRASAKPAAVAAPVAPVEPVEAVEPPVELPAEEPVAADASTSAQNGLADMPFAEPDVFEETTVFLPGPYEQGS